MTRCPICLLFFAVLVMGVRAELKIEPLGPCTRKTGLVISEIMYKPAPRTDGRKIEFVEIYNSNPFYEDISGYVLTGKYHFTFPTGTIVPTTGFIVVARSVNDVRAVYGVTNVIGPMTTQNLVPLAQLLNPNGDVLLTVNFPDVAANPILLAADSVGHSLVLARPSLGEGQSLAWSISARVGGSPGQFEPPLVEPLRSIFINEVYAARDSSSNSFVELYNHSAQVIDLSGTYLSTSTSITNGFRFGVGASIPANGFVSVTSTQLSLAFTGGKIFFANSNATSVVDAVSYGIQFAGVSSGRSPDGSFGFVPLAMRTPAVANGRPRSSDLVVNEIMFDPISDSRDEYVELYNRGTNTLNLTDWSLAGGVTFSFPSGATVPAGGCIVVAHDLTNLVDHWPGLLNCTNTFGNFDGGLNNSGDEIILAAPDVSFSLIGTQIVALTNFIPVDDVIYKSGGTWGKWSAQGGSSLELLNARADRRFAFNWADSDEASKASWTMIEATGVLEVGATYTNGPIDDLQVLLLGEGECLLDNVEVFVAPGGPNLVLNPNFETGLQDWVLQGDHIRSSWETNEGYASAHSLHIRARSHGDTGANRIRAQLTSPLAPGQTVTIRARTRWLKGWPEILLRLKGNYLEAYSHLDVPTNLGTPGRPNSRAVANTGPAISEVVHAPILPSANQPVVVIARIDDPDGVASALVNYRIDPQTNFFSVAMNDSGTNGDVVPNDGVFSATIPGQSAGTLVAFHIVANDGALLTAGSRFPKDAPDSECLIRFGDPVSTNAFGTYRMWMTQKTLNTWSNAEVLSNERFDFTFVIGDYRVIYNAGGRYAGSPNHQDFDSPIGKPCHYSFDLPGADDVYLGTDTFNKIHAPGNAPFDDPTILTEQTAYWIARQIGLPANYKRYVNYFVNGVRRGSFMEDTLVPSRQAIKSVFSTDPDGQLFKLQPWYEFDNTTSGRMSFTNVSWCTLNNFTNADGEKRMARLRWNFLPRSVDHIVNDYANVFALIDAANTATNGAYQFNVESEIDIEQWMRTFAVERACGDWDSFGSLQGQNMYAYKGKNPWKLMIWDFEVVLGNSFSDGPSGDPIVRFNPADPILGRLYDFIPFRREYFSALKEIVDGPMVATTVNPLIDAKFAAFAAAGISVTNPAAVKSWIASRRAYLTSQLAGFSPPFAVFSGTNITTTNNLITLIGTAPLEIKTITVNGIHYPLIWTSMTNWWVNVPVGSTSNLLAIDSYDRKGVHLTTYSTNITVNYTGPILLPRDHVVINEIMFHPARDGAGFVEIRNTATNFAFDLSGWRLEGASLERPAQLFSYQFPSGTILTNGQFLVIAEDRKIFSATYGGELPVTAEFSNAIGRAGGVLTLRTTCSSSNSAMIVDQVRYEAAPPWPSVADGSGASLQLIDPAHDRVRVSNWAATSPTPGTPNAIQTALPAYPPLWLNELQVNNLSGLQDSAGDRDPWIELYNSGTSPVSLDGLYLATSYANLLQWTFPTGATINPGQFLLVWCDGEPQESTIVEPHTSFRLGTNNALVLSRLTNGQPQIIDYLNFPALAADTSYGDHPDGSPFQRIVFTNATPGASNFVPLQIFINEWMAANSGFITDPADGHSDDWFELYNAGDADVNLAGFTLADSITSWIVPNDTIIRAKDFLLVWADNDLKQNHCTATDLHAGFQLSRNGDQIELRAPDTNLLDQIAFDVQAEDVSQGRWPDGGPNIYSFTQTPTPGAANQPNLFALVAPTIATITIGQTLHFHAFVTNAPVPPYVLTFSLDASAPTGARIDPRYGEFVWTPGALQLGTYSIVVRAVNPVPPKFEFTSTVFVTVLPAPMFNSIARDQSGTVHIELNCAAGKTYQLQSCDDLTTGIWSNAGPAVMANSSILPFDDTLTNHTQRFYRVVQSD